MSIAELGPAVILWYEMDVSEKAQREELESIYRRLNANATLYCSSSSNFAFASHEAYSERDDLTWWLQMSTEHMHEVLRKVWELVFISGVLRGSYIWNQR